MSEAISIWPPMTNYLTWIQWENILMGIKWVDSNPLVGIEIKGHFNGFVCIRGFRYTSNGLYVQQCVSVTEFS